MNDAEALEKGEFVLVISVGGSPQPLVESIRHYRPRHVIFIASRDSNEKVAEILQETGGRFRHETLTISDHQNLLACVRDMREELPRKLDLLGLSRDVLLLADITGGTKVMSAALALVAMEFNSRFTYVGGDRRTKDGLGTVEAGHEKIIQMDNPWDAMGLVEAGRLVHYFNAGQYGAARERAEFLKATDSEYSAFYDGLGAIIEAFRNWDIFNYGAAKNLFAQGLGKLRPYCNRRHKNFCDLYARLEKAGAELALAAEEAAHLQGAFKALPAGCGKAYLRDLAANARRCAQRGHYDDAAARLYSAVEKTAKILLARRGLNNSRLPRETLCRLSGELGAKYAHCDDGHARLPLEDSFALFCALEPENPSALTYRRLETELAAALQSRNLSLLAHGYNPVKEDDFRKLFAVTLSFLELSEEDLPEFPALDVNSVIF